jgi:DNA repair protein RecN (Recombination protein N)|tara:strand:+ start:245 stop:1918 length:1674 start_codon:yes stop_codon:yes gene_type:complete
MIESLSVNNFAIVHKLDVEWFSGLSTITGETGAGKSIAIDAISFALGARGDVSTIRAGSEQTDVRIAFNIEKNKAAQDLLEEYSVTDNDQCIVARRMGKNGRSKVYINGMLATLTQVKNLGETLLSVHSQHAHQLLLKPDHQRNMLDGYAENKRLITSVSEYCSAIKSLQEDKKRLEADKDDNDARRQLLEYQVGELNEFALESGEFEKIENEHRVLSNAEALTTNSFQILQMISDNDDGASACDLLQNASKMLCDMATKDVRLQNIAAIFEETNMQLSEASSDLRGYADNIDIDPHRLRELDERMAKAMELSRKHNTTPAELPDIHFELANELSSISNSEEALGGLDAEISALMGKYNSACDELSEKRKNAAVTLSNEIQASIRELAMGNASFTIEVEPVDEALSPFGKDKVSFLLCSNPGQPLAAISKVASGGELSRISLAIQVIIASSTTVPTLIFDEVDVGISGGTAAVVGKLLKRLGKKTQVISITHLPQVASFGDNHYSVNKVTNESETVTSMKLLEEGERINELARLLGGEKVDVSSIENAKSLLQGAKS